ncbi:excisionase family DNA-binding protein [Actinocatenispora sera]|uniref:excisionase family DNA-binding protein n=1 Tax=Actinocatenispora sera TaxID=390989 RepID=UPI0033DCE66E
MSTEDSVLTVEEAAAVMKMSTRYVRRLVAERRIPFHKVGRSVRLLTSDVWAHVQAGRVEAMTVSDVWRGMREVA